jgi:TolB-like protein
MELKQRKVIKVAIGYLAVAWAVLEVSDVVLESFAAPDWVMRTLIFFLGVGFIVALTLSWMFELTPDGLRRTTDSSAASAGNTTSVKFVLLTLASVTLAVAALMVGGRFATDEVPVATEVATAQPAETVTEPEPATTSATKTLAVLPFANLSTDPDQEYFADGLTEEMINTMAKIEGLQVTSRTSAFYFKGKDTSLAEIGEMLGVEQVLQGSVRKVGNDVRVVVQLSSVDTGFTLWTQTYDRTLEDVFAMQEEMAREIARVLSITLGIGRFDRPEMTRNAEAWDSYIRAENALLNTNPENFTIGIAEMEKAVRLDPQFVRGWRRLANAYRLALNYLPAERTIGYATNADAAEAEADRLLPPSRVQQARAARDWLLLEQVLLEDMANDPQDVELARNYNYFLQDVGRAQDARAHVDRLLRADPLNAPLYKNSWSAALLEGDLERARRDIAEGIALTPEDSDFHYYRTVMGIDAHDWQEARAGFSQLNTTREFGLMLIDDYLSKGDEAGAIAALEAGVAQGDALPNVLRILTMSEFAGTLGRSDLTIRLRSEVDAEGSIIATWPLSMMDELRRTPEFKAYMTESNRELYWRTTGQWPTYCRPVNDDFECF